MIVDESLLTSDHSIELLRQRYKISQILLEAHADHTFMDAVESGKTEQVEKFKAGDSSIQQDAISEVIRCLHSKKIKF